METIITIACAASILLTFFLAGIGIASVAQRLSTRKSNLWKITYFVLPPTRQELGLEEVQRSLTLLPGQLTYKISIKDSCIVSTFCYSSLKKARSQYEADIAALEEVFYTSNKSTIDNLGNKND